MLQVEEGEPTKDSSLAVTNLFSDHIMPSGRLSLVGLALVYSGIAQSLVKCSGAKCSEVSSSPQLGASRGGGGVPGGRPWRRVCPQALAGVR